MDIGNAAMFFPNHSFLIALLYYPKYPELLEANLRIATNCVWLSLSFITVSKIDVLRNLSFPSKSVAPVLIPCVHSLNNMSSCSGLIMWLTTTVLIC